MSLKKANEHRNAWFEGVQKCHLDESLYTVMEKIVRAEVHRLVVTDENEKVIGIISLSDILLYLVLRPSGDGIGDSESLRASDPILRERTDSISTALLYNNSNESIEEETNNELEAENAGDGLKKKVADGDGVVDDNDADNNNNNSVEEAEEALPVQDEEEKTEDNLNDNANNNNEPSSPVKSETNDEVIDIENDEEDEDEVDNELTITSNNNTLGNSLNIQREVAMVSE